MELIKSVRVRRSDIKSGSLDIKVSLYENKRTFSADEIMLTGLSNGYTIWELTYKKSGLYKDFTNDDFIKDFINIRSKLDNKEYRIIQDPWDDKAPIIRDYGKDPYYLNNGAEVYINWLDDTKSSISGVKYSKPDGSEVTYDPNFYRETGVVKPLQNTKYILVVPKGEPQSFTINKNNEFSYTESYIDSYSFKGTDLVILDNLITKWKNKIPNYNLEICSPNNESCSIIPYKSPLKLIEPESTPVDKIAINEKPKEPIKVVLSTDAIKAKNDTSLKIYIGKPTEMLENINNETDNYEEGLSPEYLEGSFDGIEETTLEELRLQDEISLGQVDSDSNLGQVGAAANIRPVSSLDAILRLAGECARECGKNPRVKYENLRISYKKGIHGLCPQGTFSVLYALTGVKSLGTLRGNANFYAYNGSSSLASTGYYQNKIKIGKDYINDSSQWQIGDVVANDYIARDYGHIQVWTGYKWVSDFTQNKIQVNNVNWNTVALWRMNNKGIQKLKEQTSLAV
jgi:hypothetical protein